MPPPERGRPRAIHEGNRQGSRPQSVDHGHPSLNVRPGLQRTPTNPSLGESQPSSVNPSDELRQAVAEPKSQSSQSDREKSMKHLLVYLKLHYLRERSDVVARELIYGKHACERNLYFNAISLKDKEPSQIVKLIGRLSVGGIDENLSCVRIPTTKMIAPAQQALKKESKKYVQQTGSTKQEITLKENPNPGRQSLVPVFDKLHEAGVRMILNLNVDDMDLPYHTDAAIERAIAGRDSFGKEIRGPIMVETW